MNPETVRQWFTKANNDLKTGKDELNTENPATDTVCFHAQQCAEKYLKGFLAFHDQEIKKTHKRIGCSNRLQPTCRALQHPWTLSAHQSSSLGLCRV